MMKLILSGAAIAALTVGAASAADLPVRPAYRAPQSIYVNPFPMWQRAPLGVVRARRGNLCWVDADGPWYRGGWRPCPRPLATRTMRAGRPADVRSAAVRAARIPHAPVTNGPVTNRPVTNRCTVGEARKQYWATSLSGGVDRSLLQGLQDAATRGEVAWLDVNPRSPIAAMTPGTNLIFYHVGGNCYAGSDCDRFPSSKPTGDRWGNEEREIDLNDAQARKIVVEDLVNLIKQADDLAPKGATVGVHLDNVHKLDAEGLAHVFNDYLQAIEAAKQQGLISKTRTVGYIAKNNPDGFKKALDQKLLKTAPLYQINENASLGQDGALDESSRTAQDIGRRYNFPVFLKTFGTDVAYAIAQDGRSANVYVTQDMARQMAQLPNIAGVAWSPDEARYHPTLFAQGSPVQGVKTCDTVAMVSKRFAPLRQRTIEGRELRNRIAHL
jgi:hypothetical protein